VLAGAPTITRNGSANDVVFLVNPAWPRIDANALGFTVALGSSSDLQS